MGGRIWSRDEELVFWTKLIPHSAKRLQKDQGNPEQTWRWVRLQMAAILGEKARREYTDQGVFEHYHQNTVQGRFSPNAGKLPYHYYVHEQKLREEQAKRRAEKTAKLEALLAAKKASADEAALASEAAKLEGAEEKADGADSAEAPQEPATSLFVTQTNSGSLGGAEFPIVLDDNYNNGLFVTQSPAHWYGAPAPPGYSHYHQH
ncbi:hypothetical protein N0V88_001267 [Collariella sp. IMI 366227]|nr:hypothetical protein N0V88_001267 [Collariella sp. IMI 366227]